MKRQQANKGDKKSQLLGRQTEHRDEIRLCGVTY